MTKTYGRGQMEWAVWRSFTRTQYASAPVPQIFRTRIKRLLEIDRDLDLSGAEVPPAANYAFAPPPSAESGEAAYGAVDAFCLAIALDLLDAGFKQAEIVFFMRYLRSDLESNFPRLAAPPSLIGRQRHLAKHYPDLPSFQHRGRSYADKRVFIIVQKVELTEFSPTLSQGTKATPVVLKPIFCDGIAALSLSLSGTMPDHRRIVTVLEVAAAAQSVLRYLEDAPVIRRGRPKA